MLRTVAWIEIVLSIMLLALAIWPLSGFCEGRFMNLDCESRAIFGVNLFGPLGLLAFTCSSWSLKGRSVTPQYFLLLGIAVIIIYWLSFAL